MEVLKDAASAAIYGAEAGNGVVLITTKKVSPAKVKLRTISNSPPSHWHVYPRC